MIQSDNFLKLKELLLENENAVLENNTQRIDDLRLKITDLESETPEKTKQQIELVFKEFKEKFPQEYKGLITKAIKSQIKESQDEVVNALYPIIGKLIKKFISKEIEKISEEIDSKLNNNLSFEGVKKWFNQKFRGVNYGDQILQETVSVPVVEQIFLLDAESSLLLGSYSSEDTLDKDMIAAMLSAITDFVEDAFQSKNQHLEWLEYEMHKIHIHNIGKADIAFVISGNPHAEFKSKLSEEIFSFMENLNLDIEENEQNITLKEHFKEFLKKV